MNINNSTVVVQTYEPIIKNRAVEPKDSFYYLVPIKYKNTVKNVILVYNERLIKDVIDHFRQYISKLLYKWISTNKDKLSGQPKTLVVFIMGSCTHYQIYRIFKKYWLPPCANTVYLISSKRTIKVLPLTVYKHHKIQTDEEKRQVLFNLYKNFKQQRGTTPDLQLITTLKNITPFNERDILRAFGFEEMYNGLANEENVEILIRIISNNIDSIYTSSQNEMFIGTKPLFINDYFIGNAHININHTNFRIDGVEHPHINRYTRRVCLGSFSRFVMPCLIRRDYIGAIYMLLQFLQTYNPRDAYECIHACGTKVKQKKYPHHVV